MPDGGYVSVIEYVPGSKNHQVLSIQKALLGDYLIRLNTGSGSDCYTTNKGISKKSGTASITDEGLASNYFQYITTQETTSLLVGTRNYKTSAYTDEKVLAKGYNGDGNDLIAYGFSTLNGTATELSEVPDSLDWYTDFDLNGLESLAVSLKKGNYTYAWFDAEFDPTLDTRKSFPFSYDESEWLYTATGSINDWKFHHNARFTDTLDVSLMANMDDSGNPEISYNGTSYIFDAPGISSSNDLIQRSYYYTETTGPNAALTHIIYP